MSIPNDRVYAETHEWHKLEDGVVTLGLTQFAADQLTDVTYVEMKKPGYAFQAGDPIGEIESVKTTSDVYSAVAGEILEVNQAVVEDPSLVNSDPYEAGWLVKVKVSDPAGLESCVDAETYQSRHAD
jgi:glycine cleavage system H protein